MKTILKLTEKDLHNIVKESVMKILKEERDWSDEEIEDRIDTEANMDDFPADIKSVKESVDEIGDTPRGNFALNAVRGRRAAKHYRTNMGANAEADNNRIINMAGDEAYKNSRGKNFSNNNEAGYRYGFDKGVEKY